MFMPYFSLVSVDADAYSLGCLWIQGLPNTMLCLTFLWFQSMRMPIHWAASGGHTEMVEYLLNFNVPVDVRDEVNG